MAVFLPKSNACVVSFYGALYCGVPYAPLDFTAPAARIQRTLLLSEIQRVLFFDRDNLHHSGFQRNGAIAFLKLPAFFQ